MNNNNEMDFLCKKLKKSTIKNDLDSLCDILNISNIEYDEFKELENTYNNPQVKLTITIERYERYIKNIDIWVINNISYLYIKDLILDFLNNPSYEKSRIIDCEILSMLDN